MTTSNDEMVIVLTGANKGIGYHMLTTLVEDNHRIAALDITGDNVRDVRDDYPSQVRYYKCDVASTEDVNTTVSKIIDQWSRIDILINNAGVARISSFQERSPADTRHEFEVNFFGYHRLIRAVLPHMLEQGTGIIHNMGSGTADTGHPGLSGYSATKGAIKAFIRSLQLELRYTDVSCTLMIPPSTNTRMIADLKYPEWMTVDPEEVGRKLATQIHSTKPVITPDLKTTVGLSLMRRSPSLWRRMMAGVVENPE